MWHGEYLGYLELLTHKEIESYFLIFKNRHRATIYFSVKVICNSRLLFKFFFIIFSPVKLTFLVH